MDGLMILLSAGIAIGAATFLVAVFNARQYADGNASGVPPQGLWHLRGVAWIVLAACGAFSVYTSLETLAHMKEKEAELTRRKTIVTSLDRTVRVYHAGLQKLEATVIEAKSNPTDVSPERLVDHLERILAEMRQRERASR